jgi:argininosuccinate lyase
MLAVLKGLPLAYQRDLQEDKAPVFEAFGILAGSLGVMSGLMRTLTVDIDRMRAAAIEGHTTATAVADALVRRGVAFRAAHHVVGVLVAGAEDAGLRLDELEDETIRSALGASDDPIAAALAEDPAIPSSLRKAAGLDDALGAADVIGGTAPSRVSVALAAARARLDREAD